MSTYHYDSKVTIGPKVYLQRVYYTMPYIPASNEPTWDEEDDLHQKYSNFSKCIYSSKYKDSKCYHYLFTKDLKQELQNFVASSPDFSCILPIGSTHPLVYTFAEHLHSLTGATVINCIKKIQKNVFSVESNTFLPKGKILVIDDITTSGKAIETAINELVNKLNIDVANIEVLCIAKTERNLYDWDAVKIIS